MLLRILNHLLAVHFDHGRGYLNSCVASGIVRKTGSCRSSRVGYPGAGLRSGNIGNNSSELHMIEIDMPLLTHGLHLCKH